jgi:hypothetical protein
LEISLIKKLILLYFFIISTSFADTKFYEDNLNGFGFCSANFFILSKSDESEISSSYKQAKELASIFAKLHYKELYKKEATQRDISKLQSRYLSRLEQEYKNLNYLSTTTYNKIGKCEAFIKVILQSQENIESMFIEAQSNIVTKKRLLESFSFTDNKAIEIPKEKVFEIYKSWFDNKPQRKKIIKLLPDNLQFMKK